MDITDFFDKKEIPINKKTENVFQENLQQIKTKNISQKEFDILCKYYCTKNADKKIHFESVKNEEKIEILSSFFNIQYVLRGEQKNIVRMEADDSDESETEEASTEEEDQGSQDNEMEEPPQEPEIENDPNSEDSSETQEGGGNEPQTTGENTGTSGDSDTNEQPIGSNPYAERNARVEIFNELTNFRGVVSNFYDSLIELECSETNIMEEIECLIRNTDDVKNAALSTDIQQTNLQFGLLLKAYEQIVKKFKKIRGDKHNE